MEDTTVCNNPWCKATFVYNTETDMISPPGDDRDTKINDILDIKIPPIECPKCRSFNNELSGGVSWKDKQYEGSRFDGQPHETIFKINNFY